MIEQQLINGLMLGSIYALVGVAFSLTIGMLNFLNFSVPGLFMLGGVLSYGLLKAGFHWSIAFVLTIAAITVVSLVIERFTYRWLRLSSPFIPLVSSIGFLIVLENSAIMRFGSESMRVPSPFKLTDLHLAGLFISAPQLLGLVIALVGAAIMSLMLKRTKLGRSIRGIAENPRTAETLGINVNRTVSSIYVITGIFAAVGGILFALNYQQVAWYMGQEVAAKGLAAMVLGGMGSLWGPVIGGFLVGLIEVFSIAYVSSDAVNAVVYGTLLALLLCWPNGLLGARISTVERM
ncbi:MAG TPA: branched-chain amino acid ABC transporter permease [Xanthobacteraceae bacterium]|nr:branched-chain amino acid ABC transporter permease [Xanthobacteraceae bacterium]